MDAAIRRGRRPGLLTGTLLIGALLGGGLLLRACSEGDAGAGEAQPPSSEVVDPEGRPEIDVPDGQAPPADLLVEDLTEGSGPEVAQGATLTLHYAAVAWSGAEIASTWERGQPLSYQHGEGRWIEGWEAGIEGMREGGERRLVVPADLAYGERGAPGIPPGEALVFVIQLLDVE